MKNEHMKINDKERKVLDILVQAYHPDEWAAYAFASLSRITKLTIPEVGRACRSLRKKGLAEYERTLVTDEGVPAGAGYRATEEGAALLHPCIVCGKRGTMLIDWRDESKGLHCDAHYQENKDQA